MHTYKHWLWLLVLPLVLASTAILLAMQNRELKEQLDAAHADLYQHAQESTGCRVDLSNDNEWWLTGPDVPCSKYVRLVRTR